MFQQSAVLVRGSFALVLVGMLALACSSGDQTFPPVSAEPKMASSAAPVVPRQAIDPEAQGLVVEQTTAANQLAGYYRSANTVLRFDSFRKNDDIRFRLSAEDGTELIGLATSAQDYVMSFDGGALTVAADIAVVNARARHPAEEDTGGPAADAEAVRSSGDPTVIAKVLARPELALLPQLSRSLGQAGYSGIKSLPALTLHRFAILRAQMNADDESDAPKGAETVDSSVQQAMEVPYCQDMRSDPKHNNCYGMCGSGCGCWSWVCGDCCYHAGCALHDSYCRSCTWYRPDACNFCYISLPVFIAVIATC